MNLGQYDGPMAKATHVVAAGGITSPAWLPTLQTASQVAANLVPILSAIWLLIQIIGYIRKRFFARDTGNPQKAKVKT